MNNTNLLQSSNKPEIIEKKLSYVLQGIFIKVGKEYGRNFKEETYHNACIKEFINLNIKFASKPKINIYSNEGKAVDFYVPDFIVENKIIVEIKAVKSLTQSSIDQLTKYLEKSVYELGYLVNFGISYSHFIRRIFTNNRKRWIGLIDKTQTLRERHERSQTYTN